MNVLKFGGTSVGNAKRMLDVGAIVTKAVRGGRVGLVVSAVTGVTNHLLSGVTEVLAGKPMQEFVDEFCRIHTVILKDLEPKIDQKLLEKAEEEIVSVAKEFDNLLTGVGLLMECSPSILDHISSIGERASTPIIEAILEANKLTVRRIVPRDYIITDNVFGNASPLMPEIEKRVAPLRDETWDVLLMPGFFGSTLSGKTTTLGRGGSDYSAAILAAALQATTLEIWTDVDGVFSADPKIAPDAFVLDEMSYPEAMELAFFGAKVLHPRTIAPVVTQKIPTLIKNTFNPDHPGTLIHDDVKESTWPVRGLSSLDQVAMIGVSGAGLRGVPGVAARVFSTMAREGISVILITQASSEYSICFCVASTQAEKAVQALEKDFILERQAQLVNPIEAANHLSIISVVGDHMRSRRGIAGSLFSALAASDVNVIAIAQGLSERNISTVVSQNDAKRAIRAAHQFFFNTRQGIQVFLIGAGAVGGKLLEQIKLQQRPLFDQQIDIRVCGIANSQHLLFNLDGIDLQSWREALTTTNQSFDLAALIEKIKEARLLNPIFVDCSGSRQIANAYTSIFAAGMHLATPSKLANASSFSQYSELRRAANRRQRRFLYSTNVGASLPIIESLKIMINSGDRLRSCRGILSGSLSFIFGLLDDGVPFSEALEKARAKGFTEPDPRDDLSGLDVARKILILARETGLKIELSDIRVNSPLPETFDATGTVQEFLGKTNRLNEHFAERLHHLKRKNLALRFVGTIENGACRVGLEEIPANDPLFQVRDGENAVSFVTDRHHPIPLVIRGYGAGPDVTAAGVFADILRTVYWNAEEAS